MKILGIDPGTAILGWGLIEYSKGKVIPLKYSFIKTDSGTEQKACPIRASF